MHEIVALERIHQPLPSTFNFPHNLTSYSTTQPSELPLRLRNATIIIVTTIKLSAELLSPAATPHLRLVAVMATGTDPVDLEACRKRGVRVVNCPGANSEAVSEHAIGLYFAARRRTVNMHNLTIQEPSEWPVKKSLSSHMRYQDGQPPLSCADEVMGIVGYGTLGKRIARLGRALGMTVLIASRKSAPSLPLPPSDPKDDRVPFEDVLRRSTVLVLSLPRTPDTMNLISTAEFKAMSPYAVLVNIARGGIVDEAALLQAVKEGQIAGAATDVFAKEPADGGKDSPLLSEEAKGLNITVSPHLAWFAQRTLVNLGQTLKETLEAWAEGRDMNIIV